MSQTAISALADYQTMFANLHLIGLDWFHRRQNAQRDPQLGELFRGCALVLHAGDVTGPEVLASLSQHAPVRAVRGRLEIPPARLCVLSER